MYVCCPHSIFLFAGIFGSVQRFNNLERTRNLKRNKVQKDVEEDSGAYRIVEGFEWQCNPNVCGTCEEYYGFIVMDSCKEVEAAMVTEPCRGGHILTQLTARHAT